jgi:ribonuclease BN (tRNA processing enzyme)
MSDRDNWSLLTRRNGIKCGDYLIHGSSWAAHGTTLIIDGMKTCVDYGFHTSEKPRIIIITHQHLDHLADLHRAILEPNDEGLEIITLGSIIPNLDTFLTASLALTKGAMRLKKTVTESGLKYGEKITITAVYYGSSVQREINGKQFLFEFFKCTHSAPCIGIGFSELREVLKIDLKTKKDAGTITQADIDRMRLAGETITDHKRVYLFAILGDTDSKVWSKNPEILANYNVIISECTFILPSDEHHAKKKKHTYLGDYEEIIRANPKTTFAPIHFSKKYSPKQICDVFAEKAYPNVSLILPCSSEKKSNIISSVKYNPRIVIYGLIEDILRHGSDDHASKADSDDTCSSDTDDTSSHDDDDDDDHSTHSVAAVACAGSGTSTNTIRCHDSLDRCHTIAEMDVTAFAMKRETIAEMDAYFYPPHVLARPSPRGKERAYPDGIELADACDTPDFDSIFNTPSTDRRMSDLSQIHIPDLFGDDT